MILLCTDVLRLGQKQIFGRSCRARSGFCDSCIRWYAPTEHLHWVPAVSFAKAKVVQHRTHLFSSNTRAQIGGGLHLRSDKHLVQEPYIRLYLEHMLENSK